MGFLAKVKVIASTQLKDLKDLKVEDIDTDAYISHAVWKKNGEELTDAELKEINNNDLANKIIYDLEGKPVPDDEYIEGGA